MSTDLNLILILLAALVASISPGPATLALAGTSMANGRQAGLALASGITTGSLFGSISAAMGLGAVMLANVWLFEALRYFGVAYLMYLAFKSARSALSKKDLAVRTVKGSLGTVYAKGLLLHLTNPKAILFFGALYAIGMPADATWRDLVIVIGAFGVQSLIVFHLYAVVFSSARATQFYLRARRWCEGLFAIGFGLAGLKILTARLNT